MTQNLWTTLLNYLSNGYKKKRECLQLLWLVKNMACDLVTDLKQERGKNIQVLFLYFSIPANLRLLVYRYGMQNSGNESSWNYMFRKYQETPLAQEKEKLLYGLASVKNITLLDRWFKHTKIFIFLQKQVVTVCSFSSPQSCTVIFVNYSIRNAPYFQDQLSNTPFWDCTIGGKKPYSFSGKILSTW